MHLKFNCPIHIFAENMDAKKYVSTLKENLDPFYKMHKK